MVGVLLNKSLPQLSEDLKSAIVWSSVGLNSFKSFRNSVYQDFESREVAFNLNYEKVTPFANEQIEMEYLKEVQFIGQEEEFNLEDFGIFGDDEPVLEGEDNLSLDNIVIEEESYSNLVINKGVDGFDYYGVELEDFDEEDEEPLEEDEEPLQEFEEYTQNTEEYVSTPTLESSTVEESNIVSKEFTESGEDLLSLVEDIVVEPVTKPLPKPKPFIVENSEDKKEVTYYNGMSLRQFLRENPRSTMDVVEKYFTKKEIMKDIQLGKVIKRGKKLFI
jgi:hypothetical protein